MTSRHRVTQYPDEYSTILEACSQGQNVVWKLDDLNGVRRARAHWNSFLSALHRAANEARSRRSAGHALGEEELVWIKRAEMADKTVVVASHPQAGEPGEYKLTFSDRRESKYAKLARAGLAAATSDPAYEAEKNKATETILDFARLGQLVKESGEPGNGDSGV